MPIPDFNDIKAPALQAFSDGKTRKIQDLFVELALKFGLTDDEQNELLPSGKQRRWHNRANWACYDLYRAGLLNRPKKGIYVITELGKQVANLKHDVIDREFLMQFPGFADFATSSADKATPSDGKTPLPIDITTIKDERTPEELMGSASQMLNLSLKKDLLDLVRKTDPFRFEQVVLDLLVAMGYGGSREEAARVTKASGDEGIDGVINEDRLGLDVIYLQAKRWQQTVGRKEIQSFVGALAGQQAHKGVFITTSDYTANATEYAKQVPQKVILIDGDKLADLMIKHNIGVTLKQSFEIKNIDSDYFEQV